MINEQVAHIGCQCGQKFQVLDVDGTDWDEAETSTLYQQHLLVCAGGDAV